MLYEYTVHRYTLVHDRVVYRSDRPMLADEVDLQADSKGEDSYDELIYAAVEGPDGLVVGTFGDLSSLPEHRRQELGDTGGTHDVR
jgi:hypothetical protein